MYIDLTQTFMVEMPVYPGDPKPKLKQIATIEKDGFTDHEITTGMHVGTHMDAPWHMIASGKKISEIDPEKFFGSGKLIDARGLEKIGPELLIGIEAGPPRVDSSKASGTRVEAGDIVLVFTGFGSKFKEPEYYEKYPELTEDFANKLVELKIKVIGIDTPSPDRPPFVVHKILLGNEILIIENLTNLEKLLNQKFEVIALPAKFETDAAPTRVIAKII